MEKKKYSDLKKKLEKCEKEKADYLAGWQRCKADFENYKKEEMPRLEVMVGFAKEKWLVKILTILDSFEKAEQETPDDLKDNDYFKGLLQIKVQIQDFLKSEGVTKIESLGKEFDPNFHEVVEMVELKKKKSGEIVEEIQKGYMIGDKLLRVTKVKVVK